MNATIKNITRIFNVIDRSLFTIDPPLDYDRTIEAITKLANMVHEFDASDDGYELWSIGEFGHASLDNLLIGAYWFCCDYHGGQSSPEYACQCAIGQVFSPGMSSLDHDEESSELTTYQALETICPQSDRTEF